MAAVACRQLSRDLDRRACPPCGEYERRIGTRSVVPGTLRGAGSAPKRCTVASGGDRRPRYEHRDHRGVTAACVSTLRCAPRPALARAVRLAARPTAPGHDAPDRPLPAHVYVRETASRSSPGVDAPGSRCFTDSRPASEDRTWCVQPSL